MPKRKGRPRKSDASRKPSGKVRDIKIGPTDELLARRREASGRSDVPAEFPLAVLEAAGVISSSQAVAGQKYAQLYWSVWGHPAGCAGTYRAMASFGLPPGGDGQDDDWAEKIADRLRAADRAMAKFVAGEDGQDDRWIGLPEGTVVRATACHLKAPIDVELLCDGLQLLVKHYALEPAEKKVA